MQNGVTNTKITKDYKYKNQTKYSGFLCLLKMTIERGYYQNFIFSIAYSISTKQKTMPTYRRRSLK